MTGNTLITFTWGARGMKTTYMVDYQYMFGSQPDVYYGYCSFNLSEGGGPETFETWDKFRDDLRSLLSKDFSEATGKKIPKEQVVVIFLNIHPLPPQ